MTTTDTTLLTKSCVPCQGGIPPLTREEAEQLLLQIPNWTLLEEATRLQRQFTFQDFAEAWAFVNKLGELAEREGHHPDIHFGWGYATVVFYTHKINGLHENDFVMAAKTDALLAA